MNIVQALKALNRERLALRHLRSARVGTKSLSTTSGQVIELASKQVRLSSRGARVFHYRPGSKGDTGVMRQMFKNQDYDLRHWSQGQQIIDLCAAIERAGRKSLVLDLGSNIGASALFFSERYAAARLLCVEPDPTNGDILQLNLQGLDHVLFRGAISSKSGRVSLHDPGHGDWGFRTGPLHTQQGSMGGINAETVDHLMAKWASDCVPVVAKIDIEGAEADLFSGPCDWMDVFPCIIIELHDWMLPGQGPSRSFLKQVAARELDFVHRGENIFLFNTTLSQRLIQQHKAA